MKTLTAAFIIGALSLAAAACNRVTSPAAPTVAPATGAGVDSVASAPATGTLSAKTSNKSGPYFTITNLPVNYTEHHISAAADVQVMQFQISGTGMKSTSLTQLAFMIDARLLDGTLLPTGYLTNFRLVYYPDGFGTVGTTIATNPATTWTPGYTPQDFLVMDATPPFAFVKQNFTGVFALVGDLAAGSYRFNVRIQTGRISTDGVDQAIGNLQNCDLPVSGDTFFVQ